MGSYTFTITEKDIYGCTTFDKNTFRSILELQASKPVMITRPTGKTYAIDPLRCVSQGKTSYQLNLSRFEFSLGTTVTFWGCEEKNHIFLTSVEPSEVMWENGGVVDAIVDLQRRVDELEAEYY